MHDLHLDRTGLDELHNNWRSVVALAVACFRCSVCLSLSLSLLFLLFLFLFLFDPFGKKRDTARDKTDTSVLCVLCEVSFN